MSWRFFSPATRLDTRSRHYPVTQADGSILPVPAMSFLRQVRDGRITPGNLPHVACEIAQHFIMLARELLREAVRISEFPDRPSRKRAMWLARDPGGLTYWRGRLRCSDAQLFQLIKVRASGRVFECDAALLVGDSESLDESERKAHAYWRGEMMPSGSEPEILFEGSLEVTRIFGSAG
jgi:hypothetical protein